METIAILNHKDDALSPTPSSAPKADASTNKYRTTADGGIRTTFHIQGELMGKLQALSYWTRETQRDIVNAALADFIARYEAQNGAIKPIPPKRKL